VKDKEEYLVQQGYGRLIELIASERENEMKRLRNLNAVVCSSTCCRNFKLFFNDCPTCYKLITTVEKWKWCT